LLTLFGLKLRTVRALNEKTATSERWGWPSLPRGCYISLRCGMRVGNEEGE